MLIGLVFGVLGYRSAYAAVFDFRYNHIPLPPFGARIRFSYAIDTPRHRRTNFSRLAEGDTIIEEHSVMWSWWTNPGENTQDQERGLSWLRNVKCAPAGQDSNLPLRFRNQKEHKGEVRTR